MSHALAASGSAGPSRLATRSRANVALSPSESCRASRRRDSRGLGVAIVVTSVTVEFSCFYA